MNEEKTTPRTQKPSRSRKEEGVWEITSGKEKGRWRWEFERQRDDGTSYRKAGSRATQAEAKAARKQAVAEFERDQGRASGETLDRWLDYVEEHIWPKRTAGNTRRGYEWRLRLYVRPRLGGAKLSGLTTQSVQIALDSIAEEANPNVARACRVALSSALRQAQRSGKISRNPCEGTEVAAKTRRRAKAVEHKRILSQAEQDALLRACEGKTLYLPVLLGLRAALRIGECCGLQWPDVDLDRRVLHVRQALVENPEKWGGTALGDPKTAAGHRSVPISPSLHAALTDAKARATDEWVCNGENGRLLPQTVIGALPSLGKKIVVGRHEDGEPRYLNDSRVEAPNVTHHDCRSSCLSYLANEADEGRGVPPAVLAQIAGHRDPATTMAYYIRASSETVDKAMRWVP